MSALPTQSFDAVADPTDFLSVAEAAQLTGLTERAIQVRCRKGTIVYRKEVSRETGKEVYRVYKPALVKEFGLDAAKQQEQQALVAKLPERARTQAFAALDLVREVDQYVSSRPNQPVKKLIERYLNERRHSYPNTPSVRTFYRLRERYYDGRGSLASMVDGRLVPGAGVTAEFTEEAFNFFHQMYATQNDVRVSVAYGRLLAMADEEGWKVPSLKTVLREWRRRVPKPLQIELKEGREARRNKADEYQGRDWSNMMCNDIWVSDHHQFDIIGIDDLPGGDGKPARLWVTGWLDEASRYFVGWQINRGPTSQGVINSFCDAVEREGLPKKIRIDNGKDYRCHRFAGGRNWRTVIQKVEVDWTCTKPILYTLDCHPIFAQAYNARAKIIETHFRNFVKEYFSKGFPGYCGGTPDERPENLSDIIDRGGLWPWSKIQQLFAEAVAAYHLRPHQGLGGKFPALIRAEKLIEKRTVTSPELLLQLKQAEHVVTVGKNGIFIDGRWYGSDARPVMERFGSKVRIRFDLEHAGLLHVYDEGDQYLCPAKNNRLLDADATPEDIKASKKAIKEHKVFEQKERELRRLATAVDPAQLIALDRKYAQMQNGGTEPPPAPAPLVFKPLEFSGHPQPQLAGQLAGHKPIITAEDFEKLAFDSGAPTDGTPLKGTSDGAWDDPRSALKYTG